MIPPDMDTCGHFAFSRSDLRSTERPGRGRCTVPAVRSEPLIDRGALGELLHREYDLDVIDLRFVPVGFSTVCYEVGDSRFLKIWPADSNGGRSAELLEVELPLLDVMDSLGLRARVPAERPGLGLASSGTR